MISRYNTHFSVLSISSKPVLFPLHAVGRQPLLCTSSVSPQGSSSFSFPTSSPPSAANLTFLPQGGHFTPANAQTWAGPHRWQCPLTHPALSKPSDCGHCIVLLDCSSQGAGQRLQAGSQDRSLAEKEEKRSN